MGCALNNNKNINDFCLKSLMKTERYNSQAHYYIYCRLKRFIIKLLSIGFKTSSMFCRPRLTRNVIRLPFFCSQPLPLKNSFLFLPARPGPFKKSPIMCRPAQPVGKITRHVPAQPGPLEKSAPHLPARPGSLERSSLMCRVQASGLSRTRADLQFKHE